MATWVLSGYGNFLQLLDCKIYLQCSMNSIWNEARRPPVEETASFLQSLLNSHGSNFLEILFGPMAKNNMKKLGGVQNVAIVLSGVNTQYNSRFIREHSGPFRILYDWWLLWGSEAVLQWSPQPQVDISQCGAGWPRDPLSHRGEGGAPMIWTINVINYFVGFGARRHEILYRQTDKDGFPRQCLNNINFIHYQLPQNVFT